MLHFLLVFHSKEYFSRRDDTEKTIFVQLSPREKFAKSRACGWETCAAAAVVVVAAATAGAVAVAAAAISPDFVGARGGNALM